LLSQHDQKSYYGLSAAKDTIQTQLTNVTLAKEPYDQGPFYGPFQNCQNAAQYQDNG